ncbi:MAG: M67 family metallopeptidase [Marinomonas sp.]
MTSSVMAAMRGAAERAHPAEACGILLGEAGRISTLLETQNVHPNPQTHFEIDPAALIAAHKEAREGGAAVLGYFHSHPAGEARPSATDQAQSAGDGAIWAIASEEEISFWRDHPQGFQHLQYNIV